ncbi:hypothetical protein IMCC21906_00652 [Spongiibacter sp. IMCC21906]|jgi:DUF971 family protein|uniref:gamma-butyrobetaine hydroxylase-like domain-containing protein n=1 Tax=Spongiibacter sp. IMCC21906 TaxID=1620392 RepID=UPI00062DD31B|nr:DUF971 domain-containing protein [Spongiibacter sp. IMCC21906]AKH68345.1 hypothetical protein IMCC21906_00652 [Spongiibacter sp. IMCC21906]
MIPSDITLHKKTRELELQYANGSSYRLSAELLRVYSPSAEVRGHGSGQEKLQTGKLHVEIKDLIPVGNYALQLVFSDEHDSGIYSWTYLYELCQNQESKWEQYLQELDAAGASRDPDEQVVKFFG